ncbi:UbiX family flavin prenyltransferase [Parvularcula sp. LCG005]|uniref:UbiX family flavin prenyltransferase n=1 Tax=Parvularcula sp. LCG005 TaxID=3078805 RepID=UPI002943553B|nr:UbiX family flavin prenyltransferase [Parvularcula sp. LCG005]WOI54549.1 UbiX family flavin prenyltransferase [Parvularcula sp. LCG005]
MTEKTPKKTERVIVGVSGASGALYALSLMKQLAQLQIETHLVVSKSARLTLAYEHGQDARFGPADHEYSATDVGAPIASGSFKTRGMIVAPCSIKTMSEIATGVTSTLLTRAADVCLKERRPLVLMVRETPFHLGHLRTMTALAEMGAIIAPPLPAFYAEPSTVEDMVDQSVARCLDLIGLDSPLTRRWGEDLEKGRRP